jgi:hypothetical protein
MYSKSGHYQRRSTRILTKLCYIGLCFFRSQINWQTVSNMRGWIGSLQLCTASTVPPSSFRGHADDLGRRRPRISAYMYGSMFTMFTCVTFAQHHSTEDSSFLIVASSHIPLVAPKTRKHAVNLQLLQACGVNEPFRQSTDITPNSHYPT